MVLCKKHPLEVESPPLRFARYVPDDTHFLDLLELSDRVALINSGVGVYAMMAGKPCFVFGQAFYQFDGINERVLSHDPSEVASQVLAEAHVDTDAARRFIHYLIAEFYSFGESRTIQRAEADGSLRRWTRAIQFYQLLLPGIAPIQYERDGRGEVPTWAPLLERFKLDIHQRRKSVDKTAPETPRTVPKPPARVSRQLTPAQRRVAKAAKLRRDPYGFFRDAKNPVLRRFRHLFGEDET